MKNNESLESVFNEGNRTLIKSKERVRKHGEVFTPQWVIEKMMTIPGIKRKTEDVFATFLESSAGEGAFLLAIQDLKLRSVTEKYDMEIWGKYALWALSSIYGIEFLEDNLSVARQNMLDLFLDYYEEVYNSALSEDSDLYKSARTILWANIVQGDTLSRQNIAGKDIIFSNWAQVLNEPFIVKRTPFPYSDLFAEEAESESNAQLNLFGANEQGDLLPITNDFKVKEPTITYKVVDIELVWREEKAND